MKEQHIYMWVTDNYEQDLKKELNKVRKDKRKKKINKQIKKAKIIGTVFLHGAKDGILETNTLVWAAGMGLVQGFKYNGNLKRGLTSAAITAGAFGVVNGIANVKVNIARINEIASREDK